MGYYIKWGVWLTLAAIVVAFLNYTLPDRDIVRIVETEVERMDMGVNSIFWSSSEGTTETQVSRDIKFIRSVRPNGRVRVYRNEDTGWIWPPYFKFDSADLQAEAANLISTSEEPKWVIVRHYGWRSNWLTVFPNAVRLTPTDDPEQQLIPWFNIVLLIVLAGVVRAIQVRLSRFFARLFDRTT